MQGSRFKTGPSISGTSGRECALQNACDGEEGYLLLGAIVAIALVMIALSVAAVKVSFALRREREVESMRRAQQYVRAIREYYLKFGRYPGSVDQLVNTNNIRFLRQKYVDPLTGKPDYRLIIVGQNKTTPKGFFGESLSGLPGSGPGAGVGGLGNGAAGNGATTNGAATNGFGASGPNGPGNSLGGGSGANNTATMGFGGSNSTVTAQGAQANGPGAVMAQGVGVQAPGSQNNPSSTTGSGGPGSNLGPIMGVGTSATGNSILTVNEQTTYDTWEFLYDPRVERLRQAGQLNQGVGTASGGGNPAGLGGATPAGAGSSGPGGANGQQGQSPGNSAQPNGTSPSRP